MKRLAVLGAIALAGLAGAWVALRQPEALTVQRITDNLFVIAGGGGNTAVFVRAEGVVVVDTKIANNGARLLEVIRTVTDRPITHILNTHTHFDHVGNNAFFPAVVEVVAHEQAATRMTGMEEFRDPAARVGLPDRTFKDTLTLFSGKDAIDLRYFGAAHTDGDAFIVFRGPGVMHAGDTFPGLNVVARDGGSAEEYPKTMAKAAAGITGVKTVIPGHGAVATWQEFVESVEAMGRQGSR